MSSIDTTDTPVRLMDKSHAAGCAAKIPPQVLAGLLGSLPKDGVAAERLLTRTDSSEDAAIVTVPAGKALVQTLDFFTPIVNDPYAFGQVAAANSLSDVYAMGGEPWCAMNIVCFPVNDMPASVLERILAGGADKLAEAHCALAGGHSVNDPEVKYGLSVTGIISPDCFASNTNLKPGQVLMLTKPLGTGLISTAVKMGLDGADELEAALVKNASRLNVGGGRVIRGLGLTAATDITGFGLGGHLLEMAEASHVDVHIEAESLPLLPRVLELAEMGLLPAGSHANKRFRISDTDVNPGVNPFRVDVVFDAQTSGGIVMAMAPEQVEAARSILQDYGDIGHVIGSVHTESGGPRLNIR
ncbi:selenide, water dikinase SelD [Desulfovibrio sp. OttesenSCG-928-G15]|nr:selenide, water dikinase SelD [Desulfovibrio sp. OttesenSCG-928-G15]